jgi:predicted enzyme related to lactoylglutathione lyase
VLEESKVAARIPVQDLQRAKSFYAEKLGLEPSEQRPGGLLYRCGEGEFALFESAGAASGDHTQMAWEVEDIEATVERLRARGAVFEEYDLPGLRTVNGIAEVAGNYPSKGCSTPARRTAPTRSGFTAWRSCRSMATDSVCAISRRYTPRRSSTSSRCSRRLTVPRAHP